MVFLKILWCVSSGTFGWVCWIMAISIKSRSDRVNFIGGKNQEGPRDERGREKVRTLFPARSDSSLSPPPHRPNVCDGSADHSGTVERKGIADRIWKDLTFEGGLHQEHDDDLLMVLPDRSTLCHFSSA